MVAASAGVGHKAEHRALADEDRIPHGLPGLVGEGRVFRIIGMDLPIIPVRAGRVFTRLQHPDFLQRIAFVVLELVEILQSRLGRKLAFLIGIQLCHLHCCFNPIKWGGISVVLVRILSNAFQIQIFCGHAAAIPGKRSFSAVCVCRGINNRQRCFTAGSIPRNIRIILHRERRVGAGSHDLNGLGDVFDYKGGITLGLRGFHLNRLAVHTPAGPKHTVCVPDGDGGFAIVRGILFHGLKLCVTVNVFSVIPHGNRPEAVSVHIRVCTVVRAGELALEFFRIRGQIIETVIYFDVRDIAEANRPAVVGEFLPTAVRIKALAEIVFPKLVRKHTRSVHSA